MVWGNKVERVEIILSLGMQIRSGLAETRTHVAEPRLPKPAAWAFPPSPHTSSPSPSYSVFTIIATTIQATQYSSPRHALLCDRTLYLMAHFGELQQVSTYHTMVSSLAVACPANTLLFPSYLRLPARHKHFRGRFLSADTAVS
jgi:hypothetical protein